MLIKWTHTSTVNLYQILKRMCPPKESINEKDVGSGCQNQFIFIQNEIYEHERNISDPNFCI